jgi:WD40 repeat protein
MSGMVELQSYMAWARGSLDLFRPHFMRLAFPLFIHTVIDYLLAPDTVLVNAAGSADGSSEGRVDAARFLLERYRSLFEPQQAQYTSALSLLLPLRSSTADIVAEVTSTMAAGRERKAARLLALFKSASRTIKSEAVFLPTDRSLGLHTDRLYPLGRNDNASASLPSAASAAGGGAAGGLSADVARRMAGAADLQLLYRLASPVYKYSVVLPSVPFRMAVDWLSKESALNLLSIVNERLVVVETDAQPSSGLGGAGGGLVRVGGAGADDFEAVFAAGAEENISGATAGRGTGLPFPSEDVVAGAARATERARVRGRAGEGAPSLIQPQVNLTNLNEITAAAAAVARGAGTTGDRATLASAQALLQQTSELRWGVLGNVVYVEGGGVEAVAGSGSGRAAGEAGEAGAAAGGAAAAAAAAGGVAAAGEAPAAGTEGAASTASAPGSEAAAGGAATGVAGTAADGNGTALVVSTASQQARALLAAFPGPDVVSSSGVPYADYSTSRYALSLARAVVEQEYAARVAAAAAAASAAAAAAAAAGSPEGSGSAAGGLSWSFSGGGTALPSPAVGVKRSHSQMAASAAAAAGGHSSGGTDSSGRRSDGTSVGGMVAVTLQGHGATSSRSGGAGAASAAGRRPGGAGVGASAEACAPLCAALAFPSIHAQARHASGGGKGWRHGGGPGGTAASGPEHPCYDPSQLRLSVQEVDTVSRETGLQRLLVAGFADGFVRLWATCRIAYSPYGPGASGPAPAGAGSSAPPPGAEASLARASSTGTAGGRSGGGGGGGGAGAPPGLRHLDETFLFECSAAEAATAESATCVAVSSCKRYVLAGTVSGRVLLFNASGLIEAAVAQAAGLLAAQGATVVGPPAAIGGGGTPSPLHPHQQQHAPRRLLLAAVYNSQERLPVWSVAFNPLSPNVFISGGRDTTAALWSTAFPQPQLLLAGHLSDVEVVAFHPTGLYALTASNDSTLRLWDCGSGDCLRLLAGAGIHSGRITAAALSPSGRYVASGDEGGAVAVWDVVSGSCAAQFRGHGFSAPVRALAFNAWGALLTSADGGGRVCVWDVYKVLTAYASVAAAALPGVSAAGGSTAERGGASTVADAVAAGALLRVFTVTPQSAASAAAAPAQPSSRTRAVGEAAGAAALAVGIHPLSDTVYLVGAGGGAGSSGFGSAAGGAADLLLAAM